jgi:hypothetical protein
VALALRREQADRVEAAPGDGREDGVTLIEIMLASVMFLAVTLGIVPMFTQSMVSNSSGNDSTKAANFARAQAEELMQLPFNHADLTVDAGSGKTIEEYYSTDDGAWHPVPPPAGILPEWSRVTTVRQYNVEALDDDLVQIAEALPSGTDPTLIHLKEIQVAVHQVGGLFNSSAKTVTVRTLRSH